MCINIDLKINIIIKKICHLKIDHKKTCGQLKIGQWNNSHLIWKCAGILNPKDDDQSNLTRLTPGAVSYSLALTIKE